MSVRFNGGLALEHVRMGFRDVWRQGFRSGLGAAGSYAKLLSGAAGRLVLSLLYFVSVANTLSVDEFGLFATAASVGIVLSRVGGLGFTSPLYRIATGKKSLIGVYSAGLIAATLASLPLVAALGLAFYLALFSGEMALSSFVAILCAEVLFWRTLETVCIVNNGMRRFGRGALIVIMGSSIRALAALAFALLSDGSLAVWALVYLGANALAALLAVTLFYPRVRLRWAPRLYLARSRDAVAVAGAEIAFYLQSELDKLLVLALGGPYTAGIYAILMRLIDLTALPVRSANTLIVQRLMVSADWLSSWTKRWTIEGAIAFVSVGAMAAMGIVLQIEPRILGDNVSDAAPFLLLALLVPAFRNLVEYESELLYARGKTGVRVLILVLLTIIKAGLMSMILMADMDGTSWVLGLNGVFATLWLVSAAASYAAYDWTGGRSPRSVSRAPLPGE